MFAFANMTSFRILTTNHFFMIALFIGGTGTISMAITRLAVAQGWKL